MMKQNFKKITCTIISIIVLFTMLFLVENINHIYVAYGNESIEDSRYNETVVKYGDINGDGSIDIGDGVIIKKYLAGMSVDIDSIAGDVNLDDDINTTDAVFIMRYLAGMKVELGVSQQPTEPETKPSIPEVVKGKTLIVYFSWSSNTERMANTIKEQTNGDILEIIPVNAYPTDYTRCTEVALEERDSNARPAIQNLPASIEEYDNILIGYPIWWHTAPMIIGTFLENYDLTDVHIYPFTQSASMNTEQFDNSMEFVRSCANNAIVHNGLFTRATNNNAIIEYLNNNNLMD